VLKKWQKLITGSCIEVEGILEIKRNQAKLFHVHAK